MKMRWKRLSDRKILDDAVIGIRRVLERVFALVKFYPRIPVDGRRVFFEDEEVVLLRDEIVRVVVLDYFPVLPILNRERVAHRTRVCFHSRVVARFAFRFSKGEGHTIS